MAGLALLFVRGQNSQGWPSLITALGFAPGYIISGQLWIYSSQYLLADIPTSGKWYGAAMLFALPVVILTLVISLHPVCRSTLNIRPFSLASCCLFSCFWILFEVLYTLAPPFQPLLVSGYAILGFPSDSLIPVIGIFGSSLLLAMFSALLACLIKHLLDRRYRPMYLLTAGLCLTLFFPVFLARIQWTWPYDLRPFEYVMQVHSNADAPDNFYPELMTNPPRLIILGGIRGDISRPHFFRQLPALENNKQSAFLAIFNPNSDACPDIFCSFGEGEGCTQERLRLRFQNNQLGKLSDCQVQNLPVHNPSFSRHPSVDAYRVMVLNHMTDSLPFLAAEHASGSELIVAFDTPARGQVIRERLLNADRARALETGRPVLRYSNAGLSAEINHLGIVEARFLPEQDLVGGQIQPMSGQTPYMRLGPYAPLGFILLVLMVFAYRRLFQTL